MAIPAPVRSRPTSVIERKLSNKIRTDPDLGTFSCGRCECGTARRNLPLKFSGLESSSSFTTCLGSVSSNCYVILLVMAVFFFIIGTLLTVIAFIPHEDDGLMPKHSSHVVSTG